MSVVASDQELKEVGIDVPWAVADVRQGGVVERWDKGKGHYIRTASGNMWWVHTTMLCPANEVWFEVTEAHDALP